MVYSHIKLPQDLQDDLLGHTSLMPFLWTVVIDIAIFFAKYKHTKYGIIVHATIAMIVTLITLATALPLLFYEGIVEHEDSDKEKRHQIIGITILIIISIQILIGFFSKMSQMISMRSTRTIFLLGRIHRYLGYLILALSKIQVFLILGLKSKDSLLLWVLIGSQVLFLILWIARSLYFPRLQHIIIPDYRRIKNSIKKVKILGEINQNRQNLGVFANYVYNIQPLKTLHPAGRHIIKTIGKRQLDRYLYGMARSEKQSNIPNNSHSFKALNLLGDPIAKLSIPSLFKGLQMDLIDVNLSKVFKLSEKGEIYQVYIKNDYQQSFEYKGFSCMQQLGRFHSLTIDKVTRLYISIGCISEANINFLERIYFQKKDVSIRTLQLKTHFTDFQSTDEKGLKRSDQLCFLIKKYQKGKLTSNLFEGKPWQLKLSCPRGEGLRIWQFKPGRIIIVAAGTGLYPFCDLIDLLFKYELLERIPSLKKQLQASDPLLKNTFLTQFKYTLYLSVNYIDDIHPLTFAQLKELNQTQKFLKLILRVSNVDNSQRFKMLNKNVDFVEERFEYLFEQIVSNQSYEKILICGPHSLNQEFVKLFARKKISEQKYMII